MELNPGERYEVAFDSYTGNLAVGETLEFYDNNDLICVELENLDDSMGNVIRAIGGVAGQEIIMSSGLFSCDHSDGFAIFKARHDDIQDVS